ncbi:MAG TPA: hypothetical protein VNJ04_04955 [Gemmatimonadaceae bacterium]|nr:hypothetical protein [Gemmatimonadaceae bacterium]
MKYASLSTGVLRGMAATLESLGVLSKQREAIRYELAIREWADAVEARLDTTIGGRS